MPRESFSVDSYVREGWKNIWSELGAKHSWLRGRSPSAVIGNFVWAAGRTNNIQGQM